MRNFFILLLLLSASMLISSDVYLKVVTKTPVINATTPVVVNKEIIIADSCSGKHDSWSNIYKECLCDTGYKESPDGCIIDPCYNYDCGNNGSCSSKLIREDTVPVSRLFSYHYEASCSCPENYVEFNLQCIENPCLGYECYKNDYCEAIDGECKCKDGYVEFDGDYLYNEDGTLEDSETTLTCITTSKVWDWNKSDAECQKNDGKIRYAYYGKKTFEDILPSERCSNRIDNCRCIISPFSQEGNPLLSFLGPISFYGKENAWVLLFKDFGMPEYAYDGNENIQPIGSVVLPKFILYNRYTGEVKIFLFLNGIKNAYGYGVLEVSQIKGYDKTMILNNVFSKIFSEGYYSRLQLNSTEIVGDYSTKVIVPFLPSLENEELWFYGDFIAGYDSNTKNINNSGLLFKLNAINKQDVTGSALGTIEERVNLGVSNTFSDLFSINALGKLIKSGKSYYNNTTDLINSDFIKDWVKKISENNSDSKWLAKIGNFIKDYGPKLSTGLAVAEFLLSGTKNSTPSVFDAVLKFNWTGITTYNLTGFTMKVPGTKDLDNNNLFKPYYDKPLGIVSLSKPPMVEKINFIDDDFLSCDEDWREEDWGCNGEYQHVPSTYYKLKSFPEIKVNPDSGLELVAAYVSFIVDVKVNTGIQNFLWWNYHKLKDFERAFGLNYLSDELIQDENNGEEIFIARFSTNELPYDIVNENLSLKVASDAEVSIKVTYFFRTKKSETRNKKIVQTYIYHFDTFSNDILNVDFISDFQHRQTSAGNINLEFEGEYKNSFKKGDIISLSYTNNKNNMLNSFYYLFPSDVITLGDFSVLPLSGDNTTWSWVNESTIDVYNLSEILEDYECNDDNVDDFNCKVKRMLLEHKQYDVSTYTVKRDFVIPNNIPIGEYNLKIPFKYYVYKQSIANPSEYSKELKTYIYKKKIKITE